MFGSASPAPWVDVSLLWQLSVGQHLCPAAPGSQKTTATSSSAPTLRLCAAPPGHASHRSYLLTHCLKITSTYTVLHADLAKTRRLIILDVIMSIWYYLSGRWSVLLPGLSPSSSAAGLPPEPASLASVYGCFQKAWPHSSAHKHWNFSEWIDFEVELWGSFCVNHESDNYSSVYVPAVLVEWST